MADDIYDTSKALADHLDLLGRQPNVMTLEQFKKFTPLFKKPDHELTLSEQQTIQNLAEAYYKHVDPQKETHIIKSIDDPTVVLILPQIFFRFKELSGDKNNERVVATHRKILESPATPLRKAQAFGDLVTAVIKEQSGKGNIQDIKIAQARYKELMDKFNAIIHPEIKNNSDEVHNKPIIDDDEWVID